MDETKTIRSAHITMPGTFSIKRWLHGSSKSLEYIVHADGDIDNDYFWQKEIKGKNIKGIIRFEPLNQCPTSVAIILRANEIAFHDKDLLNLTLRGVYALMKAENQLLNTIVGKTIIIPPSWGPDFGANSKVIVFTPYSDTLPQWEVHKQFKSKLCGINAVLPVIAVV